MVKLYLSLDSSFQFDFEILQISSQPIVQWNYVIYFHIRGSFLTSFQRRVHNLKGIVNIQGLFLLTVGYIDMTTILQTKYYYIIDRAYFIYRLFVFFISILSSLLLFYAASWRHKRDYLHASLGILFYIHNKETLGPFCTTFVLTIQKRPQFESGPLVHYVQLHP